jgi:hypothetical protein
MLLNVIQTVLPSVRRSKSFFVITTAPKPLDIALATSISISIGGAPSPSLCYAFPSLVSPINDPLWLDSCRFITLDPGVHSTPQNNAGYFRVIWDSGASEVITSDPGDFVDGHHPPVIPLHLRGVSSGTLVTGIGFVEYCFTADNGTILTLRMKAYYMPGSLPDGVRLIPPQRICHTVGGSSL